MSGRRAPREHRRSRDESGMPAGTPINVRGLPWLLGAGVLGLIAALLLAVSPAQAAATTVDAQLALSGVATEDSPTGGSVIGVHPGDSVDISAAAVPTEGLKALGLGDLVDLVNGLLNGAATFQVKADFSGLPGGKADTVIKGSDSKTFTFPKTGTYSFTWEVQKVQVIPGLLGGSTTKITTINLNGNELRQAGIKLNASNQYVGEVEVAKDPSGGGIGVQLPTIKASPSITGVGTLPPVTVPGTAITIPTKVPTKLPTKPTSQSPTSPTTLPTSGSSKPSGGGNGHSSDPPTHAAKPTDSPTAVRSVPEQIVPTRTSVVLPGDHLPGILPRVPTGGPLPTVPAVNQVSSSHSAAAPVVPASSSDSTGTKKTVNLASDTSPSPSGQLPVILAIVSIIVLALVAGTYARTYLSKRNL